MNIVKFLLGEDSEKKVWIIQQLNQKISKANETINKLQQEKKNLEQTLQKYEKELASLIFSLFKNIKIDYYYYQKIQIKKLKKRL